jgi:spermidine synthase
MEVLDEVDGVCGRLVLRGDGRDFEVIANGMFLMETRNGESERLLVSAAAEAARTRGWPCRMLLGGLGVGLSLRAALDHPSVGEVVVVEREPAVIAWNREGPLRGTHGDALADERVTVVGSDLLTWLAEASVAGVERFDAVCLDIDNGPQWTVDDGNAALYDDSGLRRLASLLRPGGVLAVWGAGAEDEFTRRLRVRFRDVEVLEVPVARGEPDVVWLARAKPDRRGT